MSKALYSHWADFGQQHCRRFIVLGHQRLYRYPLASKRLWSEKKKSSLRIQPFLLVSRRQGRSPGGTSGPQKFHTDDVNQCLHNKSGSPVVMGIQM